MLPVPKGKHAQRHSWREGVLSRQSSEPQPSSCFPLRWAGLVSCSELALLLPAFHGPSLRPRPRFLCTCCLASTQIPLSEWILSAFCGALHWSWDPSGKHIRCLRRSGCLKSIVSVHFLLIDGAWACSQELPGRFCQNHCSELGQQTLHGRPGLNSSYWVLVAPHAWLP